MQKKLHMASDHAGFVLKEFLKNYAMAQGYDVEDHGTHSTQSCDYPVFAKSLCEAVVKSGARGILVCGTGAGMSIMANRHKGIRAALCGTEFQVKASRQHNNANVLCLGERVTGQGLAQSMLDVFLQTAFEGGRHEGRIAYFDKD